MTWFAEVSDFGILENVTFDSVLSVTDILPQVQ
jgi:hypothetical protein